MAWGVGACTACPVNAYCPAGATNYTNCTASSHSVGFQSSNYCFCNAGYYGNAMAGQNCTTCPANYYCTVSISYSSACPPLVPH